MMATLGSPIVAGEQLRPDFAAFYQEVYQDVARALSMTLGDSDLGAEAADEAMVRCYQRWSTVSGYDNPAGWVYRVGLNWATSIRRRFVTKAKALQRLDRPQPTETDVADPAVAEALDHLDVDMRAVIVCRLLLDWSVQRTAETLGIAEGTVKSRLSRGLEKLERSLHHYREEL